MIKTFADKRTQELYSKGRSKKVVIVWFGYAVAHTGKDASSDLTVVLITVPPFFLVSLGLWLLGGKLLSRLRSSVVTSP